MTAAFHRSVQTTLKFKAELYQAILKFSEKYSQKELQAILGEPQPRVSELLNGKIANKSVDKLLYYAGRLGIEAKAKFAQTHKEVGSLSKSLRWPSRQPSLYFRTAEACPAQWPR